MSNTVLVLNSGSSSIKFGLFDMSAAEPTLLCKGLLDEHETKPRLVVKSPVDEDLFETRSKASDADSDHLFADVLGFIENRFGEHRLRAVGHRVVHGGPDYSGPVELTDDVYARLEALTPLAPLHQPRCLEPVRTIRTIRPALTQIACFDTAFHHNLIPPTSRFAIPRRYEERGVRRYGFHGLSFEYVAGRLAEIAPQLVAKHTVIAHLGNGASLCALRDRRSIDTTMGLTPLDGLVMGTRSGTIDPGVLLYLQQHEKMSIEDVQHLLYHESGLFGVSGISSDMRVLLASGEAAAREAVELFTFRAAQQVAMMATTLGGLDCLVFTGGIGEHAKEIRSAIAERLGWLGVRVDAAANDAARERISSSDSTVDVFVIPTNEELMIARHCAAVL
jgi:acetate kinase